MGASSSLTGQRRTEIGDLSWPEIDLEKRQIELPEVRTKSKRPHLVPLSDQAPAILQAVPRGGSDFLFGRGDGYRGFDRSKGQLDDRIAASTGKPLPHWTVHDLRRSFVTHIGENGFSLPHVTEAIVNHVGGTKAGVAGVYNKALYLAERRQALDLWGNHITTLVAGGTGKVVAMRKRGVE